MTQANFQRVLGRLVTDRDFRARLSLGVGGPRRGLSAIERRRLMAIAAAPGLALTARLIDSFRLGKLITLLPLTRALLGPVRFAARPRPIAPSCRPSASTWPTRRWRSATISRRRAGVPTWRRSWATNGR